MERGAGGLSMINNTYSVVEGNEGITTKEVVFLYHVFRLRYIGITEQGILMT